MESETTLVRADSAVELNAVAEVYMNLTVVVHPWHTERDDTLWLHDALDDLSLFEFRVLIVNVLNGDQNFRYCLQILQLAWMLLLQLLHNFLHFHSNVSLKGYMFL